MSAIQPIEVATPNRALAGSVSSGPGSAEPSHPFAEVMRSAVSPGQTAQKSAYPSQASPSSRLQFNRASIASGAQSNRADASISDSSIPAGNVNASTQTGEVDDANAPLPPLSADANGAASSRVDGQTQASISTPGFGDRWSEGISQTIRVAGTETASSPAVDPRKSTASTKQGNQSQGASGHSAAVTAAMPMVSAAGIVIRASMLNLPQEQGAASSVTDPISSKSNGSPAEPVHSSVANRAAASGLTAPTLPAGVATDAAAIPPHAADVSSDGIVDSKNAATLHAAPTSDGHSNLSSNSDTTQSGDSTGNAGASQPAVVSGGGSAPGRANGSANPSGDTTPSSTVSTTGTGTSGTAGNDPVGSGGNGAATSIHDSNGSKSNDFTAAMPTPAMAGRVLAGQHINPADSSVGLQNGSSVFSSGNHPGAPGSFSSSSAVSTAARATPSDAFTALDSAALGERGVLLHAAPHQVAVGIADPSLGWVEVRAERVSGQIAAAVTANSAASHAALTSVLPTMASYLQEHHAGVQQVHVESSLTGGQAGTGSQGQTASQSDAQTGSDRTVRVSSAMNAWNAGPIARATISASQGTNVIYEGHHFSIRA